MRKHLENPAMLSSNDPSVPDGTPRPSYYTYALYSRAFGDQVISADSSDPTVKIYASKFAGGEIGLIVVNENNRNKDLVFEMKGFQPQGKLMGWVLTGKDLNAPQMSWNGEEGPEEGEGLFRLIPFLLTVHYSKLTRRSNCPFRLNPLLASSCIEGAKRELQPDESYHSLVSVLISG